MHSTFDHPRVHVHACPHLPRWYLARVWPDGYRSVVCRRCQTIILEWWRQ